MKKSISVVLVLSILAGLFAMCGVTAFAEENNILDYITYEIDEYYEGVVILSCDPSISGDIVIPDTIAGYPVKVIEMHAFSECDGITAVYIPETIIEDDEVWNFFSGGFGKNVEKYTVDENNEFYYSDENGVVFSKDKTKFVKYPCGKDANEYVIPDGVETIATGAFCNCTLLTDITIPDGVVTIYPQAFMDCSALEYIEIPDSVKALDYGIFSGCTSLETVIIGDGVSSFSDIFDYCTSLKNIELGSSISEIDFASATLPSLESITVDENNPYFASVDGCLVSKDGTNLIIYPMAKGNSVTLPENVTNIPHGAIKPYFIKNIDLTGVSKIEYFGFYQAFNLESVVLPEEMQTLEIFAFIDCYSMKDVYIYNPDLSIGEYSLGFMINRLITDVDSITSLYESYVNSNSYEEQEMYWELIDASVVLDDNLYPLENFTIHGYAGSTAEAYANEHGFNFVLIDSHNYVDTVITPATYTQTGVGGNVCEFCEDVLDTYEIPMLEIEDSEEKIDKDTGVSVVFPEGTFDGEAEIEVTPVEDGEAYKLISHKEGNYKVTMFDINVTVEGQKVQPNGTVLVQIPLPKGYNQNKCVVYYVADDGTMEELKTYHNKDGYVYFETNHFSYYAILEETTETENNSTENENELISYLRGLLNKYIAAFLKFIDMIKAVFHMA